MDWHNSEKAHHSKGDAVERHRDTACPAHGMITNIFLSFTDSNSTHILESQLSAIVHNKRWAASLCKSRRVKYYSKT